MKDRHLKLWLRPPGATLSLEAVAFNRAGDFVPGTGTNAHCLPAGTEATNGVVNSGLQMRSSNLEPVLAVKCRTRAACETSY